MDHAHRPIAACASSVDKVYIIIKALFSASAATEISAPCCRLRAVMEPADDDDDEPAGREGYRGAKLAAKAAKLNQPPFTKEFQ
jgi:hypothetical protein